MALVQLKKEMGTNRIRSLEEMEEAMNRLMVQFRQIDEKYDLMVRREINKMYRERMHFIMYSTGRIEQSESALIKEK